MHITLMNKIKKPKFELFQIIYVESKNTDNVDSGFQMNKVK